MSSTNNTFTPRIYAWSPSIASVLWYYDVPVTNTRGVSSMIFHEPSQTLVFGFDTTGNTQQSTYVYALSINGYFQELCIKVNNKRTLLWNKVNSCCSVQQIVVDSVGQVYVLDVRSQIIGYTVQGERNWSFRYCWGK